MARNATRRTQIPVSAPRHVGVVLGDSLTSSDAFGVNAYDSWTAKLPAAIKPLGAAITMRNFAVGGTTTAQMLARVPLSVVFEQQYNSWPEVAVIYGGANDPGASISGATTTNNIATMVRMFKSQAVGSAATQAALPAGITPGVNYVVQADGSTTGGVQAGVAGGLAGTQAGVQTWQSVNGLAGEAGWGRISTPSGGTAKILVVTPHFLNWTSGGDVMSTHGSHSGQNATYAGVDTAVKAAASAENVPVLDMYSYMQDRLIAGIDPQNSGVWHVATTNQHLNPYGQWIFSQAMLATVQAQTSPLNWLNDLVQP